ncbi:hypothetical protein KI385_06760 [Streptomyces inhibens]|nr:hypothetical protein [Streptomyces inhibens]UKY55591.1 hypothetical protein KI385_06760 [Streptomyces inhibens]
MRQSTVARAQDSLARRTTALGVFAAVAVTGTTSGLLLSGIMRNGRVNWRLPLLMNVPLGLVVLAGTWGLVEAGRQRGRLDVWGAITGVGGMLALALGLSRAFRDGWADTAVLTSIPAAIGLLVVFLIIQARTAHPLMPLRLYSDPRRSGSYVAMALCSALFSVFNYFFQRSADPADYTSVFVRLLIASVAVTAIAGARLHRRYERKAEHFLAFTSIACTLICYRRLAK